MAGTKSYLLNIIAMKLVEYLDEQSKFVDYLDDI